jgi:hypothetical protein
MATTEDKVVSTAGSYRAVQAPRLPSHSNSTKRSGLQRRGYAPEEDWPDFLTFPMAIDFNLIYKSKALRDMGFGIGDVIYETGCIFTKYTKWPWMTPGSCYETNAEGEVWVEDETDVVYSRYGPEFCG